MSKCNQTPGFGKRQQCHAVGGRAENQQEDCQDNSHLGHQHDLGAINIGQQPDMDLVRLAKRLNAVRLQEQHDELAQCHLEQRAWQGLEGPRLCLCSNGSEL